MSLEKDIKQSKFRNEHQRAMINIIYTYHWINGRLKWIFDTYNITSQQFNILRILRGSGKPLSTFQIRARMLDKMSDTSRIVDRLVEKKLVQKSICSFDRRLVDVSITAKGLQLLRKMDKHEVDMDAVLQNLSSSDVKKINTLLDKVRK